MDNANSQAISASQAHLDEWIKGSAINPEIARLNVLTVTGEDIFVRLYPNAKRLNAGKLNTEYLRYYENCADSSGWWIENIDIDGNPTGWGQFKADTGNPLSDVKYRSPKGKSTEPILLRMPEEMYWAGFLMSERPLIITEGAKKAAALLSKGLPAIGLVGVNNFRDKDKNLHPTIAELSRGREVYILFDSDPTVKSRSDVNRAKDKLAALLTANKADVSICHIPSQGNEKVGIDDYIVSGGELTIIFRRAMPWKEWQKPRSDARRQAKIRELIGHRLRFNEIKYEVELDGKRVNRDLLYSRFLEEFGDAIGNCSKEKFLSFVEYLAREHSWNPIKNYFDSLGTSDYNLDDVAVKYFGSRPGSLESQMVRKWLIAGVARTYEPGCKMDNVLILVERRGGRGKSTWFESLVPDSDYFCDDVGDIQKADEVLKLHKYFISELPELDWMYGRVPESQIMRFLSRKRDDVRKPYAHDSEERKRRGILAGSTNKPKLYSQAGGNRRYWIVPLLSDRIDIDLLKRERDAIWAAAKQAYFNKEPWWFADESILQDHLEQFRVEALWEPEIKEFLETLGDRDKFHTKELRDYLEMDRRDPKFERQAKRILEDLGWKASRFYIEGQRDRGYLMSSSMSSDCPPTTIEVSALQDIEDINITLVNKQSQKVINYTNNEQESNKVIENGFDVTLSSNLDTADRTDGRHQADNGKEVSCPPDLKVGARVRILAGNHRGQKATIQEINLNHLPSSYRVELDSGFELWEPDFNLQLEPEGQEE